jgi:nickel superoxide dismutase
MMDLMAELSKSGDQASIAYQNSMSRYVAVKEQHAEKAKREVRVIWGDFIKASHVEKFPELPDLVHKIMQLGSKCRQTADRDQGLAFVEAMNQFAEVFWSIKDVKIKKAKAPYAPALDMVYPDL